MGKGETILVVDDEPLIVEMLRDFLAAEGFEVATAADAPAARARVAAGGIGCILLDVMLPGETGFDLCRRLRETDGVPILFLSARDGDGDKIRGLGLGADDYIAKSASPGEVIARVKAVLRRARCGASTDAAGEILDFGRLTIDLPAHEVRVDGRVAPLTPREFAILRLLAAHPRRVFTRDEIYERCWGDFGDRHTVAVHIGRLREKIEAEPGRPRHLITVWGVGYRFEGERR